MSDELDEELRLAAWRNRCPNITVAEAESLEPLRQHLMDQVKAGSARRALVPSGPEWMLAGFRAGWRARAATSGLVDVKDLVVSPGSQWPEQRFVVTKIEANYDGVVEVVAQRAGNTDPDAPLFLRGPREHFEPAEPAR